MSNNVDVAKYLKLVFEDQNIDEASKYWKNDEMIQHNPKMPNGVEFLKKVMSNPQGKMKYDNDLVMEKDDIVSAHGRYSLPDGKNMIASDYFRIEDGKIVEHWDVIQEEVPADKSVNGNSMFPIK